MLIYNGEENKQIFKHWEIWHIAVQNKFRQDYLSLLAVLVKPFQILILRLEDQPMNL